MTDVMLLAMVKVKRGDICLGNLQVLLSARYSWLWMKGYFFFLKVQFLPEHFLFISLDFPAANGN